MSTRSASNLRPPKINLSLQQLKQREAAFDQDLFSNPSSPKVSQKKSINFKKVFKKSPKSYFQQHEHLKDSFERFNKKETKPSLAFSHSKQNSSKLPNRSSSLDQLKSRFSRNPSQPNVTFSASNAFKSSRMQPSETFYDKIKDYIPTEVVRTRAIQSLKIRSSQASDDEGQLSTERYKIRSEMTNAKISASYRLYSMIISKDQKKQEKVDEILRNSSYLGDEKYSNYRYNSINEKQTTMEHFNKKPMLHVFDYTDKQSLEKATDNIKTKTFYKKDDVIEKQVEEVFRNTFNVLPQQPGSLIEFESSLSRRRLDRNPEEANQVSRSKSSSRLGSMLPRPRPEELSRTNSSLSRILTDHKPESQGQVSRLLPQIEQRTQPDDPLDSIPSPDIAVDGRFLGQNLTVRQKKTRQEFAYYSQISNEYLMSIRKNIDYSTLNECTYEEYKLLKGEGAIRNVFTPIFSFILFAFSSIEEGICVKILRRSIDLFRRVKPFIADRILLALGVNPRSILGLIPWENFKRFKEILIYRDAELDDVINFVIKFLSLEENNEMTGTKVFRLLRNIREEGSNQPRVDPAQIEEKLAELKENYAIYKIINPKTDRIDFRRFKRVYTEKKLKISELIDLIVGL